MTQWGNVDNAANSVYWGVVYAKQHAATRRACGTPSRKQRSDAGKKRK